MELKKIWQILLGLSITPIITLALHQPSYASRKYDCDTTGQYPITYVRGNRSRIPMLVWQSEYFHIDKAQRCRIITNRLQRYDDNQMLPYLTSRKNVNNYPVICIVERKGANCLKEDVLITLKPGTDVGKVLSQLQYFRRGATARPIPLSGSKYLGYDENGDGYVNLNQILEAE